MLCEWSVIHTCEHYVSLPSVGGRFGQTGVDDYAEPDASRFGKLKIS